MNVEVVAPEDSRVATMGDLNSRRSTIASVEYGDDVVKIFVHVPAAQMFGFTNTLADLTQGRGLYSAQFSHYKKVRAMPDDDPWPEPTVAALRA